MLFRDLYPNKKWLEIRAQFDERMSAALSVEMLDAGWHQLTGEFGEFESAGSGKVWHPDGATVVDVPMKFATSDAVGRVAYTPAGLIAGLFILNPSALQ